MSPATKDVGKCVAQVEAVSSAKKNRTDSKGYWRKPPWEGQR
jgi:hypothetical protein